MVLNKAEMPERGQQNASPGPAFESTFCGCLGLHGSTAMLRAVGGLGLSLSGSMFGCNGIACVLYLVGDDRHGANLQARVHASFNDMRTGDSTRKSPRCSQRLVLLLVFARCEKQISTKPRRRANLLLDLSLTSSQLHVACALSPSPLSSLQTPSQARKLRSETRAKQKRNVIEAS